MTRRASQINSFSSLVMLFINLSTCVKKMMVGLLVKYLMVYLLNYIYSKCFLAPLWFIH